jgi:hypothetical protein
MSINDSCKQKMNYTLRVIVDGQRVQRYQTHSLRRFYRHLRTINWEKLGVEVYLKVSYGKQKDIYGKMVTLYNDGVYDNKQDLMQAVNTFMEK